MNEFNKIKFIPRNKYKLMDETNFVIKTIDKIRPILNNIFDTFTIDNKWKGILEKNNFIIYIALTEKLRSDDNKKRIGCLASSEYNEIILVLYDKAIKEMLKDAGSKIPDSQKYHILFETLIHELCHLYLIDEEKNIVFTKKVMNLVGIKPTY